MGKGRNKQKLKGKAKRIAQIKRERKTRPVGKMVSRNRMLDYKIQQTGAYGNTGAKGHGCGKKVIQLLRMKYPELFRTH